MSWGILKWGDFCPGGFVLGGYCLGGYCPGNIVQGDIVLEPSAIGWSIRNCNRWKNRSGRQEPPAYPQAIDNFLKMVLAINRTWTGVLSFNALDQQNNHYGVVWRHQDIKMCNMKRFI